MPLQVAHLQRSLAGVPDCLSSSVGYGIYYGVSANTRRKWDIEPARLELG